MQTIIKQISFWKIRFDFLHKKPWHRISYRIKPITIGTAKKNVCALRVLPIEEIVISPEIEKQKRTHSEPEQLQQVQITLILTA